ncbi:MAG: AlpA family transcriptional regulator [Pseudomonadota bacterium]
MAAQNHSAPTFLRRRQVEARTGLSRSTIYERIKAGTFPSPVSLGAKAVGWIESEIDAWACAQVRKARKVAQGVQK